MPKQPSTLAQKYPRENSKKKYVHPRDCPCQHNFQSLSLRAIDVLARLASSDMGADEGNPSIPPLCMYLLCGAVRFQ